MLVVASGDYFVFGHGQDRPDADFVTDTVVVFDFKVDDLGRTWCSNPEEWNNTIPKDQRNLHPHWMVCKDSQKNVDDAGMWMGQICAVRIFEISRLDQAAIEHAGRGNIAFHNLHISPGHFNVDIDDSAFRLYVDAMKATS